MIKFLAPLLLGSEAQQRATTITGQISQIAAQSGVEIQG